MSLAPASLTVDLVQPIAPAATTARTKAHLEFAHEFRAIAILVVIASHCINRVEWGDAEATYDVLRSILKNGTFYFVFISGFLFQHLLPRFATRRYYTNKLKFVLLPYALVSLPMIFYLQAGYGETPSWFIDSFGNEGPLQKSILYLATSAHSRHTWYILMAAILFLLAPAFKALDRRRALWALIFVAALVYSVTHARGKQAADFMILLRTVYYLSVYMLGMLACRHYGAIAARVEALTPELLFALVLCVVFHFDVGGGRHFLGYAQKSIASLLIITWLPMIKWGGENRRKFFDYFATRSFGLFFVHYFIADFLTKDAYGRWMGDTLNYGVSSSLLLFVVVLGSSVLAVEVVKLISGRRSRYLIGA